MQVEGADLTPDPPTQQAERVTRKRSRRESRHTGRGKAFSSLRAWPAPPVLRARGPGQLGEGEVLAGSPPL